jgi:hypothetical protein
LLDLHFGEAPELALPVEPRSERQPSPPDADRPRGFVARPSYQPPPLESGTYPVLRQVTRAPAERDDGVIEIAGADEPTPVARPSLFAPLASLFVGVGVGALGATATPRAVVLAALLTALWLAAIGYRRSRQR